jgi:hypothetical protein
MIESVTPESGQIWKEVRPDTTAGIFWVVDTVLWETDGFDDAVVIIFTNETGQIEYQGYRLMDFLDLFKFISDGETNLL